MEHISIKEIPEKNSEESIQADKVIEYTREIDMDKNKIPDEMQSPESPAIKDCISEEELTPDKLFTSSADKHSSCNEFNQRKPEPESTLDSKNNSDLLKRIMNEAMKVSNYIKLEKEKRENSSKLNSDCKEILEEYDGDENMKAIHEYVNNFGDVVRSECYYCTVNGKVKGMLTIKDGLIVFDPLKGEENAKFLEISKYHGFIDLKDICDVQILKLPNETAQYIKDDKERQGYIYDYYLQLALSTVNGNSINRILSKHTDRCLSESNTKKKNK